MLFIKKGIRLEPTCFGGGQEKGIRSGTESVPLIAGLGASVEELAKTIDFRLEGLKNYRNIFLKN